MRIVHAASDRFDAWRHRRRPKIEGDRLSVWWTEPRMPAVEDTGTIVATPEDLADIGPADPVRMPGQRRRRHAAPKRPVPAQRRPPWTEEP
jgi:hypothetical protein